MGILKKYNRVDMLADSYLKSLDTTITCLQDFPTVQETPKAIQSKLEPRICPNCGATVKSYVCEYCDTVFEKPQETNVDIDMLIDGKELFSVVRKYEDELYRDANGHLHRQRRFFE